jgi:hypothetical protein
LSRKEPMGVKNASSYPLADEEGGCGQIGRPATIAMKTQKLSTQSAEGKLACSWSLANFNFGSA